MLARIHFEGGTTNILPVSSIESITHMSTHIQIHFWDGQNAWATSVDFSDSTGTFSEDYQDEV